MHFNARSLLVSAAVTLAVFTCLYPTQAGTFKRIVIDGNFSDWAGVPIAYSDAEDASGSFDIRDVYVANDEQFLYVRATLHAPADYSAHHHHIVLDRDADLSTGHPWLGVGSELMIEDGSGYQQKNGGFNEGGASGLDWAVAPTGVLTQFEARISRSVKDAEGMLVLTHDFIALALQVLDSNWADKDNVPGTEGIPYEFAAPPTPFTGTLTLVDLTQSSWQYNDTGSDPGPEWLDAAYDDQQAGWGTGQGLFGFGATPGVYPAPIQTPLAPGTTTYYLRTRFHWDHDVSEVGLVVSNYVSDGMLIYLNGTEARRFRLPDGDLSPGTPATGGPPTPGQPELFGLPSEGLVIGENILQVALHQTDTTRADLVFGLWLTASDAFAPLIEDPAQPEDRNVLEGDLTTLSVGPVMGTPPLTYQWFKDGAPIPGATGAALTINPVLVGDAAQYTVEITNAKGSRTSSRTATLTTTPIPVSLADPSLPADVAVAEGNNATLEVAIAGSPVLAYQWFKDTNAIPGATNPQLVLNNLSLTDAGLYSVTVSNRISAVTSRPAKVTVLPDVVAPALASLEGSAGSLVVTFSEPVDPVSASVPTHYQLTGGLAVQTATPDPLDARIVRLNTSPQTFGTPYVLTVMNVRDRFGNPSRTIAPFRSAILIDGNLNDWAGIPVAHTEPKDTDAGIEFKDVYLAHDDDYLYVRLTFHAPVGPFPVDHFYHINLDADGDLGTGRAYAGIGLEVMIENGGAFQQKNGGFNEGVIDDLNFQLAPETQSDDFECRISRKATYHSDGLPVFTSESIALVFDLISGGWSLIEAAPSGGVPYTFAPLAPLSPGPLSIRTIGETVEITWPRSGTLEFSPTGRPGDWTAIPEASSPYTVEPTASTRFYRLSP